jgi:hypothetical protein
MLLMTPPNVNTINRPSPLRAIATGQAAAPPS